jgi:hypothetical protein
LPWLPVLPTSGLRGFYGNTDEAELFRCAWIRVWFYLFSKVLWKRKDITDKISVLVITHK